MPEIGMGMTMAMVMEEQRGKGRSKGENKEREGGREQWGMGGAGMRRGRETLRIRGGAQDPMQQQAAEARERGQEQTREWGGEWGLGEWEESPKGGESGRGNSQVQTDRQIAH